MARLVVVSNRLPSPKERGARAGGLAVVLAEALRPGSLWFGWSGRRTAETGTKAEVIEADGITYATIDIGEADYQRFYVSFANRVLWPLCHFRLGLLNYDRQGFQGYLEVNRAFGFALLPLLEPDDLIWVHDYQLIPLGAELRAQSVHNRIGFFLHIPFVPPSILQCLPRAESLLEALCAYDVIGFQTRRDRDDFLECVVVMLGVEPNESGWFRHGERIIHAVVTPVGIDPDAFANVAAHAARGVEARRLKESLVGRGLAIGVERLDYSKGLPNRFVAFGQLLAVRPEHRRQISFLQIAARSREDVDDYRELRSELDRLVGDTNGRFSEFDWVPLRYITRPISRRTIAGFFRIARMGVVTPLRDGMNLVAKEFVAAQSATDPGVLILSRFAGAADELSDALMVNPFDSEEIAEAMHRALTMTIEERRSRFQTLREKVWATTAQRYCSSFLSHLADQTNP
jgi:trehalose 6-phosphate synthase